MRLVRFQMKAGRGALRITRGVDYPAPLEIETTFKTWS